MAKTKDFGWSNTTVNDTVSFSFRDLGLMSNYGLKTDAPKEVDLTNSSSPVDQEELISLRCKPIPTVNTRLKVQYPNPVKSGIQWQAQAEEILKVTDEQGVRVDHPIVAYLTVRHDGSADIADSDLVSVLERLMSALYKNDGSLRIGNIRRSALKPTAD